MIVLRTTRRHAAVAILAVCALVLGGLGWATRSAIRLERVEAREARAEALHKDQAIALSRLDDLVFPVLNPELTRPYEHFRPRYKSADPNISGTIMSPLQTLRGPDWILLHFQATETDVSESWISPQTTEEDFAFATPAFAIPAADRRRQASPENWLAALRDRYTPLELLQMLEQVVAATGEARGRNADHLSDGETYAPDGVRQRAAEFLRRGTRLLRVQREENPASCWPETVAFENLEAGRPLVFAPSGAPACVDVMATPMKPIWLDLTLDGQQQLAFVRTVTVETGNFCTLQGVLIDWPRLQEVLETDVGELFPEARIVPVPTDVASQYDPTHSMMQAIPARLETGPQILAALPGLSTGLTVGLIVAWGATILALAAIGYGTMKYVTMAERRLRFVSAVTHELRTPLTSFQLYSDLLADMPEENAEQRRHHAERLRVEAKRLSRLVENVLAYSHIGDSQPTLHWRRISPQALLDALGTASEKRCRASGKVLVIDNRCPQEPGLETDPEFATQILTNLLENACKYSSDAEDPHIWLTASMTDDGSVTFEVDDAGPGVSPHDRRAVFKPFRRSGPANDGQPSGLGLGLALSDYWAHCLGGRLTLRRSPRNTARYTSFVLTLPLSRTA